MKSTYSALTNMSTKMIRNRLVASDFGYKFKLDAVVPAPLAAAADTDPSSEVVGEAVGTGAVGGWTTSSVPHTPPPD